MHAKMSFPLNVIRYVVLSGSMSLEVFVTVLSPGKRGPTFRTYSDSSSSRCRNFRSLSKKAVVLDGEEES